MGDWNSMMNERGLLLAFFGALGGAVRSAALRTTWREGLRVIFIGSLTAFGVGALGPYLLAPWMGPLPKGVNAQDLGFLCSAAFLIGLIAVTMIERLVAGKRLLDNGGENEKP